jgi:hypothetical protein
LYAGILRWLRAFYGAAAERSIHEGYLVIELNPKKVACIASDYDERFCSAMAPRAPRALHEPDGGPEFGLRHLSFGFTFWRHPVPQPSS